MASTPLPLLLKRNDTSAGATAAVRVNMRQIMFAARIAYSWKKRGSARE